MAAPYRVAAGFYFFFYLVAACLGSAALAGACPDPELCLSSCASGFAASAERRSAASAPGCCTGRQRCRWGGVRLSGPVWLLVSPPAPEGRVGICLPQTPQEQGIVSVNSLCALHWLKKCPNFYVNALHMLPCSPLARLGPRCPTPPDLLALPHLSILLLRFPTPAWQCP